MRWFVDASSLGKRAEKQTYCVEADSWQRALQVARELRGDPGALTGFSIELLDDGFSALDPVKRLRYVIHQAPADAALTAKGEVAPAEPAVSAPSPSVQPGKVEPPGQPPVPLAAAVHVAPAAPAPTSTPEVPPPAAASPREPPKVEAQPASAPRSLANEAPPSAEGQAVKVPAAPSSRPPAPDLQLSPKVPGRARGRSNPAMAAVAIPEPAPVPQPPPPLEVVAQREQDPSAASPLTYREFAYYVDGTPDWEEAEQLLREQLTLVQSTIAAVPRGKLVNLALFNVRFRGRPPLAPLATLSWKDWQGDAVVTFPESTAAAAVPLSLSKPSSKPPPSAPSLEPPATVADTPTDPAPPIELPVEADDGGPPRAQEPSPEPPTAAEVEPPTSFPVPVPSRPAPAPDPFPSAPPEALAPQTSRGSDLQLADEPRASTPAPRLRGDELIADLFDVMHDLYFLQDAVEGAEFCLTLALEKLGAGAGIVHLFDINRSEFVITCAGGTGGETLLLERTASSDPILSAAMRKQRPLVVKDAQALDDVRTAKRYTALGGARTLIVAPVVLGGRFLGAIELLNPVDGSVFSENDAPALSYIAEKLGTFLAEHGIQIDTGPAGPAGRSAGAR